MNLRRVEPKLNNSAYTIYSYVCQAQAVKYNPVTHTHKHTDTTHILTHNTHA